MQDTRKRKDTEAIRSADFRLLIGKLEKRLLAGKNTEACLKILRRGDIWSRISPEDQVRWARLAQMAGDMDLALDVLGHINSTCPDLADAWIEHIELLSILGNHKRAAQVLAAGRPHLNEVQRAMLFRLLKEPDVSLTDLPETPFDPFETLRQREQLIANFLELFSGREDCFARQWVNKDEGTQGYVPVRRPIEPRDVEDHLSGHRTYGIYLMRSDSTVKTAVLDVDLTSQLRAGKLKKEQITMIKKERTYMLDRITELAKEGGLVPLVEFSGAKGYHFWFFFQEPVSAQKIRAVLESISQTLNKDLSCFKIEVFPKQDTLSGKGFGNLVKLPLGIHRLTGKRSYFIQCNDRSVDAQLKFLLAAQRSNPQAITMPASLEAKAKVFVHPRMKQWAAQFPELVTLETLCPPLGQIIACCRNGNELSIKEEKILFQTVGFLPRAKSLLHHILSGQPEYNPHLVDYRLSRVSGSPLGCKRIHSLLGFSGDMCSFKVKAEYPHPLLHINEWNEGSVERSEKIKDLASALENLKAAIAAAEAFLK